MRSDEFINLITKRIQTEDERNTLRAGLPLGYDSVENTVFAFRGDMASVYRHVCVTGIRKTAFIKRLLVTLSCLYNKDEANVLVLSPKTEYAELLHLNGLDATVPYIRDKADLENAMLCVKELVGQFALGKKCKKLFLILDGVDELSGCNVNGDLSENREFLDLIARKKEVTLISGTDLIKSIFSGYPGAYVGIGNCLVTTREDGKADVTYVGEDSALTMPAPISYPCQPSFTETLIMFNAERKGE